MSGSVIVLSAVAGFVTVSTVSKSLAADPSKVTELAISIVPWSTVVVEPRIFKLPWISTIDPDALVPPVMVIISSILPAVVVATPSVILPFSLPEVTSAATTLISP